MMRGQRRHDLLVAFTAALFLCLHLALLRPALEDIDSVNFALAIRDFDVTRHQPHPPGYPVFTAIVSSAAAVLGLVVEPSSREAVALAVTSAVAGATAVLLAHRVFLGLGLASGTSVLAALLVAVAPLTWVQAARPLSDMAGLAAALGAQLAILRLIGCPVSARPVARGALTGLVTGVAIGVRSQVLWLTLPLLGLAVGRQLRRGQLAGAAAVALGTVAGICVWLVPLLLLTGGASAYVVALGDQAGEDFAGVPMLVTHPGLERLLTALHDSFITPWAVWWLAVPMTALALAGAMGLARREVRTLALIAVAWVPYAVYHLLFQETETTRYALPIVLPLCACVAVALLMLPRAARLPGLAAVFSGMIGVSAVSAWQYARQPPEPFSASGALQQAAHVERPAAWLMHRRVEAESRRARQVSPRPPVTVLPAPAAREWQMALPLWLGGETRAIWWLADPRRADRMAVDPRSQHLRAYVGWPAPLAALLGGMRPAAFEWHAVSPPSWVITEGWALTPELAGLSHAAGAGPSLTGAHAHVRRDAGPVTVLIGGRHIGPPAATAVALTVDIGRDWTSSTPVPPGSFHRTWTVDLPPAAGPDDTYAPLSVSVTGDAGGSEWIALEQFDAQPQGVPVVALADGWFEPEYDFRRGRLRRWMSDRAVLEVSGAPCDLDLIMHGTFPRRFRPGPDLRISSNGAVAWSGRLTRPFEVRARLPRRASGTGPLRIELESSQAFVASEHHATGDNRRLSLEVRDIRVVPAGGGPACATGPAEADRMTGANVH